MAILFLRHGENVGVTFWNIWERMEGCTRDCPVPDTILDSGSVEARTYTPYWILFALSRISFSIYLGPLNYTAVSSIIKYVFPLAFPVRSRQLNRESPMMVYKNGLIAELIGSTKPTIHANTSGDISTTSHCTKMPMITIDVNVNAVNVMSAILKAILRSVFSRDICDLWMWMYRLM